MRKIGDNFIRWESLNHSCSKMRQYDKEYSKRPEVIKAREALKKIFDGIDKLK